MHSLVAGAVAGLLHVVSGPDHLIAVAPLAMQRPLLGLRIGFSWGLGHAMGVLVVGAMGVILRSFIDVAVLSNWAELTVGVVLMAIGIWALTQMKRIVVHKHPHRHGAAETLESFGLGAGKVVHGDGEPVGHFGAPHASHPHSGEASRRSPVIHAHVHVHALSSRWPAWRVKARVGKGAFVVGAIHGAAGTGHLFGVLPSLMLPPPQSAMYLGAYGAFAALSMGGFGFAVGTLGNRLSPRWLRSFMMGCGMTAVLLGLYWFGSGLLTLNPIGKSG